MAEAPVKGLQYAEHEGVVSSAADLSAMCVTANTYAHQRCKPRSNHGNVAGAVRGLHAVRGAHQPVLVGIHLIEADEEQVEPGQQRVRQVDVASHDQVVVVRAVERVRRRHHAAEHSGRGCI